MKFSDILSLAIWGTLLANAFLQGRAVPSVDFFSSPIPGSTMIVYLLFPFLFFVVAAFFQRRVVLEIPIVGRIVDGVYGDGAHRRFMYKLRPSILLLSACAVLGVTGTVSTYLSTQAAEAYMFSSLFLSAALGLLCAYVLSLVFPPTMR